ncbi:MAG TPA: efflux RND transporter permease subunit [Rhizomicrobium sp.]|nr:efflux RND transporter permease subunit [Rhizomicrobium sp.]
MSRFFIDRPVFAWVIAIVIMLLGVLAIKLLPVEQYPDIAPPSVNISATYPGASAQTVENNVTQVIEQQLTGIDNLLYFSSTSDSSGDATITATFASGTNPDIAQVQVQNRLQQAIPLLPVEVNELGVTVTKSRTNFLLIAALYDSGAGRYTNVDIGNYLEGNFEDPLARVPGVGQVHVFGSEYAMRIWLNPRKLNNYGLTPDDVAAAVEAQNTQVAAGEIGGQPSPPGQQLDATVTAQSRLQTPAQFRAIILKTETSGALVRLSDVARVQMGAEDYSVLTRFNGHPAAGIAIQLAPGANALTTATLVKARIAQLVRNIPPGMELAYPVDTTTFVSLSIHNVIVTLAEAIVLVVVVMFVFLQTWRATLIPAITIPVVLLGTFAVLYAAGYTINVLTMFALVLAIGLLVDDAIIVVENVERIMTEEGLGPREATRKSMDEITGALVGIAMVLSAVFLPMAFIGGSTGVIYRQFSITIVSAMALSILVALILTPTLCATFLKPVRKGEAQAHRRAFAWFNRNLARAVANYRVLLVRILDGPRGPVLAYAAIVGVMVLLFLTLPTGFLPVEDQGFIIVQYTLPTGAELSRTLAVAKQIENYFLVDEKANVANMFIVTGFSFAGSGQNVGLGFIHLKDWSERSGAENHAPAIVERATAALSKIRDADVYALIPPSVPGLGESQGFDFELEDHGNLGHNKLEKIQDRLLALAARDPKLEAVRPNSLPDTPELHVHIDSAKAMALGLSVSDIDDTLTAAWAGTFINEFINGGRVKYVYMEGDAPYRAAPHDLNEWYVRNAGGGMVPFSSFSTSSWTMGPAALDRYNGFPSLEIEGSAAPGQSSGTAMAEMERLANRLPSSTGYEWTGLSYQEQLAGAGAFVLYSISILVVFLSLAALYESWSIPFAVLLVIPLGVVGALLATMLRGLTNDVFFQVGLLTIIGLSAKNAILIVEFAEFAVRRGEDARASALEASRLRLRPILMTSLAFMAGVAPLTVASSAGAASQHDIGTGVIGGMLSATLLAIFFVPLFFLLIQRAVKAWMTRRP